MCCLLILFKGFLVINTSIFTSQHYLTSMKFLCLNPLHYEIKPKVISIEYHRFTLFKSFEVEIMFWNVKSFKLKKNVNSKFIQHDFNLFGLLGCALHVLHISLYCCLKNWLHLINLSVGYVLFSWIWNITVFTLNVLKDKDIIWIAKDLVF